MSEFEKLVKLLMEHGRIEASNKLSHEIDELITYEYIKKLTDSIIEYIEKHKKDPWKTLRFFRDVILYTSLSLIASSINIHGAEKHVFVHLVEPISEAMFYELIYLVRLDIEELKKSIDIFINALRKLAEKYPVEVAKGLLSLIDYLYREIPKIEIWV